MMKMRIALLGLVAGIFLAPSPSSAQSKLPHKSKVHNVGITLYSPMKLPNGTVLQAGQYRLEFPKDSPSPEVVFYKNGKEVTRAAAKVVSSSVRNVGTEITSVERGGERLITEVSPSGWRQKLVFSGGESVQSGN